MDVLKLVLSFQVSNNARQRCDANESFDGTCLLLTIFIKMAGDNLYVAYIVCMLLCSRAQ